MWGSGQEGWGPTPNVDSVGSTTKVLAWVTRSAAVSSCFREAGGKLALFTANIVERFSHPNKIEAQEGKKKRGEGRVHPKL